MPHLSQDPVTKRWRARVKRTMYGPAGPRVRRWSKTFNTKTAAREWGLRLEDLIDGGGDPDAPDPRAPAPTVREWSERWMAARVAEPTTLAGDRSRIATHVLPRWGEVPLDEVSPLDVQSWVRQLSKVRAADTVRKVHSLLGQMCDDAVKERLLVVSPCAHTDLPTVPPGRELWLTEEQVASIADAALRSGSRQWGKGPGGHVGSHGGNAALASGARDTVADKPAGHGTGNARFESSSVDQQGYALIWTLYLTGARWGEVTGLRVQDLDFLRRRIRIAQVNTRQGIKGYPKGRRYRTVPMPSALADILSKHLAETARLPAWAIDEVREGVCEQLDGVPSLLHRDGHSPERFNGVRHTQNRSALVFANANGGPVSDANFRHRIWKPAIEAAGLGHLNPRIHDLRHSLASRLVQQGVPMSEIAAQLGHSSVLVSARYAHLGEGRHDAVLRALEGPEAGHETGGTAADR